MQGLLVRLRAQQPKGGLLRRYSELLLAAFIQGTPAPAPRQVEQFQIEPLSARERAVLQLLAQGYSNQEIARQLVVTVGTVKTHLHHLFAKLQATNRFQAVTRARELGLLER